MGNNQKIGQFVPGDLWIWLVLVEPFVLVFACTDLGGLLSNFPIKFAVILRGCKYYEIRRKCCVTTYAAVCSRSWRVGHLCVERGSVWWLLGLSRAEGNMLIPSQRRPQSFQTRDQSTLYNWEAWQLYKLPVELDCLYVRRCDNFSLTFFIHCSLFPHPAF